MHMSVLEEISLHGGLRANRIAEEMILVNTDGAPVSPSLCR